MKLKFKGWNKNELTYENEQLSVGIVPYYRSSLDDEMTLETLLEEGEYVHVFDKIKKEYSNYTEGELETKDNMTKICQGCVAVRLGQKLTVHEDWCDAPPKQN